MKHNKKGFSLLEMMVVIAVIAILVSIIIPVMGGSTIKANAATNAANLRSVEGMITSRRLLGEIVINNLTENYTYFPKDEVLNEWGTTVTTPNAKKCIVVEDGQGMWVMLQPDGGCVPTYLGYDAEYFAYIAEHGVAPDGYKPDPTSQLLINTMKTFDKMHEKYDELRESPLGGFATGVLDALASKEGGVHGLLDKLEQEAMLNNGQIPNKYADTLNTLNKYLGGGSTPEPEVTEPEETEPEVTEPSGGGNTPSPCVTPDTFITMADGSMKPIADLTYDDQLLVWNFYTGAYDVAPVSLIINHGYGDQEIIELKFEDGTNIEFVNAHAAFDADLNNFVDITAANVASFVGHNFVKMTTNGYEYVEMTGYEVKHEYDGAISLLSHTHYNAILNGMLTISPSLNAGSLYEPFEVHAGMKYDAAEVQKDIETYGQYTYEEFSSVLTPEQFEAFGIANAKVSVGKGNTTFEAIIEMFKTFAVPFL